MIFISFWYFCTCLLHVKCWLSVKPKNFQSVTRSIMCSFDFNWGIRFSMFRCLRWKIPLGRLFRPHALGPFNCFDINAYTAICYSKIIDQVRHIWAINENVLFKNTPAPLVKINSGNLQQWIRTQTLARGVLEPLLLTAAPFTNMD